jgi:hypothetical protein
MLADMDDTGGTDAGTMVPAMADVMAKAAAWVVTTFAAAACWRRATSR